MSLGYGDLLRRPHWRTLVDRPGVVISQSNGRFDADLAVAAIQQQRIASVARLAGALLLRATNRSHLTERLFAGAVDGILERLARRELHGPRGSDVDLHTSGRIAACTCSPAALTE